MQSLTQSGAASEMDYALKEAERRKVMAHSAKCSAVGVAFVSLVAESLGSWSEGAVLRLVHLVG